MRNLARLSKGWPNSRVQFTKTTASACKSKSTTSRMRSAHPAHAFEGSNAMKLKAKLARAQVRLKCWFPRLRRKREIFVIMDGGLIHEIVNLPPNIIVTVL